MITILIIRNYVLKSHNGIQDLYHGIFSLFSNEIVREAFVLSSDPSTAGTLWTFSLLLFFIYLMSLSFCPNFSRWGSRCPLVFLSCNIKIGSIKRFLKTHSFSIFFVRKKACQLRAISCLFIFYLYFLSFKIKKSALGERLIPKNAI